MAQQIFTRETMYERTMDFSVRIINMVRCMPRGVAERALAEQLLRSATSIGANYREASHAKSANDFAAKLKICEGEAAESLYWIQLIIKSNIMSQSKMTALEQEAKELVSILTTAARHAYAKRNNQTGKKVY